MITLTLVQARKLQSYAQDRATACKEQIDVLNAELAHWTQEYGEARELERYLRVSVAQEYKRRT